MPALHCIALHYTALHALHCTDLDGSFMMEPPHDDEFGCWNPFALGVGASDNAAQVGPFHPWLQMQAAAVHFPLYRQSESVEQPHISGQFVVGRRCNAAACVAGHIM